MMTCCLALGMMTCFLALGVMTNDDVLSCIRSDDVLSCIRSDDELSCKEELMEVKRQILVMRTAASVEGRKEGCKQAAPFPHFGGQLMSFLAIAIKALGQRVNDVLRSDSQRTCRLPCCQQICSCVN